MSATDEYVRAIHNAMRTDPRLQKLQGHPEFYNTYQNALNYLLNDMITHPEYCHALFTIWVRIQKLCDEVIRYLSANAATKPDCFNEVLRAAHKLFLDMVFWYAEIWFKGPRADNQKVRKRSYSV